jgi:hypothetical protein
MNATEEYLLELKVILNEIQFMSERKKAYKYGNTHKQVTKDKIIQINYIVP